MKQKFMETVATVISIFITDTLSKPCEHLRWSKWELTRCNAGIIIQRRACKKCGWIEIKSTEYVNTGEFEKGVEKAVKKCLDSKEKTNE